MPDIGALIGSGLNLASLIAQGVNSGLSASEAQAQAMAALQQAQANVAKVGASYDALGRPNYKDIDPGSTQLGASGLGNIRNNPQDIQAENEAMAQLKDLADHGGLSLADMQSLNEIQGNLNHNVQANRQGLANQYAARGQLGSGQQLAMELSGQQDAAQKANQAGESTAAQAQQRALQAIGQRGTMGRQMNQDEYQKQADAAKANDLIKQRNMENSVGAQKYNNTLQSDAFNNDFRVTQAKAGLLTPMNDLALKSGAQQSGFTAAQGNRNNAAIGAAGKIGGGLWDKLTGGSGGTTPGPGAGAPAYQPPSSDPSEWISVPGTNATSASDSAKLNDDDES